MSPTKTPEASHAPETLKATEAPQVPEGFEGGLSDLSLLPQYPNHVIRYVWDIKVKFKCIHSLKNMFDIISEVSDDDLFFAA